MRFLVDVDGVLADFVAHFISLSGEPITREEINKWDFFSLLGERGAERARKLLSDPEFWRTLPTMVGAREGIEKLRSQGEVYFVTSPWTGCSEWVPTRFDWLGKNFDVPLDHIVITKSKYLVKGCVLIDDAAHNVVPWAEHHPDGNAVIFDAPYNRVESLDQHLHIDEVTLRGNWDFISDYDWEG